MLLAKLRFHDTTAKGRLLNRFGKDLEGLDSSMADNCKRSKMFTLTKSANLSSMASQSS